MDGRFERPAERTKGGWPNLGDYLFVGYPRTSCPVWLLLVYERWKTHRSGPQTRAGEENFDSASPAGDFAGNHAAVFSFLKSRSAIRRDIQTSKT